ncbi:MAG: IPT/TIG domain-containing protein [Bacteriovoracaceae bacterium]
MGLLLKFNVLRNFSFYGMLLLILISCNKKEGPVESISIDSLSSSSGPSSGGESVTITGDGLQYTSAVLFGGTPCTSLALVSSTTVSCVTPAHAAGVVSVVIVNAAGQSNTLSSAYTYIASPTVSSVSPSSGYTTGGDLITITGSSFDSGASVVVGGNDCTGVTYVNSSTLTCTTPSGTAGAATVTVINSDTQSASLASAFTYDDTLSVTNVSPRVGSLAGGGTLTISGKGFVSGATVTVGGAACTTPTFVSSKYLTCILPAHAAGAVTVQVTNPDTTSASKVSAYTYQAAPTVTSISSSVGPVAGGSAITITGTGFLTGASVSVGGSACTLVTVVSSTSITCALPSHTAGLVSVTVTNTDSQSGTLAAAYTYQAAPTVASISPSIGALAGGTSITITGTGFLAGASVSLGGSACAGVTVVSSTSITCTTSAHAAGVVSATVTNSDSQSGSRSSAFTYRAAPAVTSVSPSAGALAGGSTLTITGSGFITGATVSVGGSSCTSVSVVSSTSITCTLPAHAAGAVSVVVTNSDSQSGTLAAAYTYQAAPTVSSVSPSVGQLAGGTSITITGTGFLTGASVSIGGSACSGITVVNATTITCTTPAHAAGVVSVSVTNSDSQVGSSNAYTYRAAPTVTSVSPSVGPLAGGTNITITGTGFVGSTVDVGGLACTAVVVVSSTSITCTSPAHVAGAVTITVTNDDNQSASIASAFTYQAAPTISSVSPIVGPLAGNTTLTITGTGFLSGATATVAGSSCTNLTVVNSTTITCQTPAHAAGAVNVVVTNTDTQTVTSNNAYTYQAAPTVTSISPSSGTINGGTSITITGTGFLSGALVTLGGVLCSGVTVVNSTTITCITDIHSAGGVSAVVTNSDSQTGTLSSAFTYRIAPTVTSVTPSSGPVAGGTTVTIRGSGYYSGASVTFNGSACSSVTYVDPTTLTCVTPANAAGVVTVAVTNADSQTGSNTAFTYRVAPTVINISPSIGSLSGGTTITVTGTGFVSGASVSLGGSNCYGVAVSNSTTLTCTTSSHAAGAVTATVTNTDSQSGTLAAAFTYSQAPSVTSVSPSAGALAGGTAVTITGTGFQAGATVQFGAFACTGVSVDSSTSITCTTPANVAGVSSVSVTNTDTLSGSSNAYTYQAAPTVTSVYPSAGALAGGTTISITGTGFVSGATVTIDGSACTSVNFISATRLTCVTPAHAAGIVSVAVTNSDTQSGSSNAYTYQSAPTVISISPVSGFEAGGDLVTITGTGFVSGASVNIGSSLCTGVTVVNPTTITCTTPLSSPGTVAVSVTNDDTQSGSTASLFTFVAAPTVTSVSPSAGALAGGTSVTITGTGFVTGATVSFGGSACAGVTVVSATTITCTTAAHAAEAVSVTVTNTNTQSGSASSAYTYQEAPTVSSISPNAGALAGGTNVTISGSDFLSGATVTFDGSSCTNVVVVNATTITCTTPAHAVGAVNIVITNTDTQTGSAAGAFTYQPGPTVTSVSPTIGAIGGGTNVTITGTDFITGATVNFGSSACTGVTVVSSTSITCTTPLQITSGAVSVTVTNSDQQTSTLSSGFIYLLPPTITTVAPNGGPLAGGTTITVTGSSFVSGATVTVGGVACASVNVASATSLTCTTSAHAAGAVNVAVTNPDGQTATATSSFTYQNAPTVTSVSPNGGPLTGGTSVTITGTGFVSGAAVTFGSSYCTSVTVVSSTSITCTTPSNSAGAVTVTVLNGDTQSGSAAAAFTYAAAPTISSVAPTSGFAVGGTVVTITGTGFVSGATVTLGSSCTPVTFVDSTTLTCTTTSYAAGAVSAIVTNPDTQTGTLSSAYTYVDAPTITSISPTSGTIAGGTLLSITGTGFTSGATVTVGGVACTSPTVVSSTSITCTTGAKAAGTYDVVVTNTDTQTGTLAGSYTYVSLPATLSFQTGTSSPNPPDPDDYGSTIINITHTFTLINSGDSGSTTAITVSLTGTDVASWLIGTDNCTGNTLAPGASCTVQVTFLGAFLTTGSYSATLEATAATGGTDTNSLTGSVP